MESVDGLPSINLNLDETMASARLHYYKRRDEPSTSDTGSDWEEPDSSFSLTHLDESTPSSSQDSVALDSVIPTSAPFTSEQSTTVSEANTGPIFTLPTMYGAPAIDIDAYADVCPQTMLGSQATLNPEQLFAASPNFGLKHMEEPTMARQSSSSKSSSPGMPMACVGVSGVSEADVYSDSERPPRGTRRTQVEHGSSRAVHLEKNREAARKCRSKQKRQQNDLVEMARTMERKNKLLRSEVEFLKNDMHDLMGLVYQHSSCPDQRLTDYVQREASRIAKKGKSKPTWTSPPKDVISTAQME